MPFICNISLFSIQILLFYLEKTLFLLYITDIMQPQKTNREFFSSLWWSGMILGILGAVAVQLAGVPFSAFQISAVSDQQDHCTLVAVVSNSSPLSRQFRSNRNRTAPQSRLHNFRSGNGGICGIEWVPADFLKHISVNSSFCNYLLDSKNYWTNFIISALPVRAGPTA